MTNDNIPAIQRLARCNRSLGGYMNATAASEIEGRKRMDAQDIRHARITRYDRQEDDPSFDALENFRQDRTHRRVIQDWE